MAFSISGGIKNQISSSSKRGSHNEGNYGGMVSHQGEDMNTTAQGAGAFEGVWWDSPYGPVTYGDILNIAAAKGDKYGQEAFDLAIGACGNVGQVAIITMMGVSPFINAWHFTINDYGDAAEYLMEGCPYPSAVGEILSDAGEFLDDADSDSED